MACSNDASSSLWNWFRSSKFSPSILILDGGVSTHLEHRLANNKYNNDEPPSPVFSHRALWSSSLLLTSEGQQRIYDCHTEFLNAGCNVVSTVTYQCHFGLTLHRDDVPTTQGTDGVVVIVPKVLPDEVMTRLLQDGVKLARAAIQDFQQQQVAIRVHSKNNSKTRPQHHVVASIGCLGGALADGSEYTGDYASRGITSVDPLVAFHQRKLDVLWACQPDAVAFETVPSLLECRAILRLLSSYNKKKLKVTKDGGLSDSSTCSGGIPCWLSLACNDGALLNDGSRIEDALSLLTELDPLSDLIQAVGINCCDTAHVPSLLRRMVRYMATVHHTDKPPRCIVLYPNSGEQWDAVHECWLEGTGCTTPKEFAQKIQEAMGVVKTTWNECRTNAGEDIACPKMIVGGCCRTSPETIAAIRKSIDQQHEKR